MQKFFITGTDTDIGKTFATCAILKAFIDANFNALAIKPIQTGCFIDKTKSGEKIDGEILEAPDVLEYAKISKNSNIKPRYALKFPASPHFSASLENLEIKMDEILEFIKTYEKHCEILLVEGAGGLFVPLNESETFLDLMQICDFPIILVCKNQLGAINHTLQSVEILKQKGLKIAALVLNFHDEKDEICVSNFNYLKSKISSEIITINIGETLGSASKKFKNLLNFKKNEEKIDLEFDKNHLWHPYTSALNPLKTHGVKFAKENKIYTEEGCLIDGMSSWWCVVNGYNNEALNLAATTQISHFSHIMFGGLTHAPAINLGKKLLEIMPEFSHIFYSDSGSVSVEVALKMALQYQQSKNPNKNKFLSFLGGYHGDTFGAMSVCDPKNGMHSLFNGFLSKQIFANRPNCPYDAPFDESSFENVREIFRTNGEKIAAVIIEPLVQGAGGMWFYNAQFLRRLREICNENDTLLIFDEIATGFYRTGEIFAYKKAGVTPDIITIGKAMTGGFMSFASTLATQKVAQTISQNGNVFMHGPTFMANPLACGVALKNIEILTTQNTKEMVKSIEITLKQNLEKCKKFEAVRDARVLGAIGVVEMRRDVRVENLQEFFIKKGVFIRPFGKNIYIMPPFISPKDDIIKLCDAIFEAIRLEIY